VAATIAFGILIVGATSAFAELKSSLDDIWHAPPPAGAGWKKLLRARMLSFSIVLALAFMLLVSLVVNAALAVIDRFWGALWTASWFAPVADAISTVFSFSVVTALFAVIFKMLPNARIAWRDVTMGAIITALLFAVGKRLIGIYLGNSAVASSYGAAGSVVALMLWVYYSAQIFFFGAELTRQYALQFGSLRGRDPAMENRAGPGAAHGATPPGAANR
jgi:membrane protein